MERGLQVFSLEIRHKNARVETWLESSPYENEDEIRAEQF